MKNVAAGIEPRLNERLLGILPFPILATKKKKLSGNEMWSKTEKDTFEKKIEKKKFLKCSVIQLLNRKDRNVGESVDKQKERKKERSSRWNWIYIHVGLKAEVI